MIDENKEELASLYAMGLLSGAELVAFEEQLKLDPALRELTKSLQGTVAHLALAAPAAQPSSRLRERIFNSIEDSTTGRPKPASKSFATIWAGWAMAACLAVAATYFGGMWSQSRSEAITQKERADLALLEQHRAEQELQANRIIFDRRIADMQRQNGLDQLKIAKLAALNGNSPDAVAIAVWNPLKQQGVLTVQDFPRISEDQSYQLWVIDAHHKNPVSSGVFTVDEHGHARLDFHPTESAEAATQFAISRERKGGASAPQGPIVAAGAL